MVPAVLVGLLAYHIWGKFHIFAVYILAQQLTAEFVALDMLEGALGSGSERIVD